MSCHYHFVYHQIICHSNFLFFRSRSGNVNFIKVQCCFYKIISFFFCFYSIVSVFWAVGETYGLSVFVCSSTLNKSFFFFLFKLFIIPTFFKKFIRIFDVDVTFFFSCLLFLFKFQSIECFIRKLMSAVRSDVLSKLISLFPKSVSNERL